MSNRNLVLFPELVLEGYTVGVFPMADSKTGEISWYQPQLRAIIPLENYSPSRSLRKIIKKEIFDVKVNFNFELVMRNCAVDRDKEGTWISEDIIKVYTDLHHLGYAHSVEAYFEEQLVGGLYGIAIGAAFFGESMFYKKSNASQVAFYFFVERLKQQGFELLDSQFMNSNVKKLGAIEIPHVEYLKLLQSAISKQVFFI